MLRTVAQSFAPVSLVDEASLGLLVRELSGLLRSGLRLNVCVSAASSVAGGQGCGVVQCEDCGVTGHASKRYGGCKFFIKIDVPRSGSPPVQRGRQRHHQRTWAQQKGLSTAMLSPPSSRSNTIASGSSMMEELLRVPSKPAYHKKTPVKLATIVAGKTPITPTRPRSPPTPCSSKEVPAPLPSPPAQPLPTDLQSPIDDDVILDSDHSGSGVSIVEGRMDRVRMLRRKCRKYFKDKRLAAPVIDGWERVLKDDMRNNKEMIFDLCELLHILPNRDAGEKWSTWEKNIEDLNEALLRINEPTLLQEIARRRQEADKEWFDAL